MISLIVAFDQNQLIGVNNQLPWHYKEDLKYFKVLLFYVCKKQKKFSTNEEIASWINYVICYSNNG